jgi:hypothetical protein
LQPHLRARSERASGDGTLSQPRHVFLVDGSGFIFRAFHGLPPMTRPDGTPVNAVYGFTTMLMKLVDDTDADHIAVIFDTARKTFRSDLYPEYKAHRPPPPPELIPQFALVRDADGRALTSAAAAAAARSVHLTFADGTVPAVVRADEEDA